MWPRIKLTVVLWLGVVIAGCALPQRQRALLADGERAFRDKRYPLAVDRLTIFLSEAENRPEAVRALYVRGMALALSDQRARAYADLQRAAGDQRDPPVAARAHAMLGVLSFEDGNWDEAARRFVTATSALPSEPPVDALLFRLGICEERRGRWAEARTHFQRIVNDFRRGPYAAVAGRRLELNADHYAVQCGVFSRPEGAAALADRLRQAGIAAAVSREGRGGALQYVVVVGRYPTYAQAINALARVRGVVPEAVLRP